MIAIIKYHAGNIMSVANAVERLGYPCCVTNDRATILAADKVIFPGVGEAASAMSHLKEHGLDRTILEIKVPFLGICLGLQLMCHDSEEGNVDCLGIFDTTVSKFPPEKLVPHMGWNNCNEIKESPLLKGITVQDDFYFVHSFYAGLCASTIATCDYIRPFSAVLQKDNYYATQFHPEKSASIGEKLLQNFLNL